MLINNLKTDRKKELSGVWVAVGDGGELLIARANNLHYLAMYRKLTKPYWQAIRGNELPIEKHVEIVTRCVSETVLLGWRGIQEIDPATKQPVDVPYTPAKAFEYLSSIADFRELVQTVAEQQFRFREEDLGEAVETPQRLRVGRPVGRTRKGAEESKAGEPEGGDQALAAKPQVWDHLEPYWTAYQMLRQTRVLTAGVGAAVMNPITYGEVLAYAKLHRWEGECAADLAFFIRVLDNRFLTMQAEKAVGQG